jgi:hypothetical protein
MILMNELQKFIKEMVSTAGKGDFSFDLLRWSEKEPYWCVFACKRDGEGFSGIKGVTGIGGHFCIGKEENIHSVLSELADSGWRVEIHQGFFD